MSKKNKRLSFLELLFGRRTKKDDDSFRVILIIISIGFVALMLVSLWASFTSKKSAFWGVLGLSVIVGLGAIMSGGLLGFLFGIPRSLQQNETAASNGKDNQRFYSNNTNLEQISDWLTKIIVGVSLTQLPALQNQFHQLSLNVSRGFNKYISADFSFPLASCIMIFYSITGFLAVYLWARIYLLQQLNKLESNLYSSTIRKVNKLEIARLSGLLTEYNRTKNRMQGMEAEPPYAAAIAIAQPNPIKYIDDPQKERWGGKNEVNFYKLDAVFKKNLATADEPYQITLTVTSTDPNRPLSGDVYFLLHDSFYKDYLRSEKAVNNAASTEFGSFEAFTVAALVDGGKTKLELDLNSHPDCPDNYKYSGPLLTSDDVKKELDELKGQ